jgi:hypothetical protein
MFVGPLGAEGTSAPFTVPAAAAVVAAGVVLGGAAVVALALGTVARPVGGGVVALVDAAVWAFSRVVAVAAVVLPGGLVTVVAVAACACATGAAVAATSSTASKRACSCRAEEAWHRTKHKR